jgi:hypothetical protein
MELIVGSLIGTASLLIGHLGMLVHSRFAGATHRPAALPPFRAWCA